MSTPEQNDGGADGGDSSEFEPAATEETVAQYASVDSNPNKQESTYTAEERECVARMRFNWRPQDRLSAPADSDSAAAAATAAGDGPEGGCGGEDVDVDDCCPPWRIRTNRREISPNGTVLSPALTAAYVARDTARRSHREAQNETEDQRRRLDDATANEARALAERRRAEASIVDAELAEPGNWNGMYRHLLDWREGHGEEAWDGDGVLRVMRKTSEDRKLNPWLSRCRADYQKDVSAPASLKKRPYRVAAMERLGFVWQIPQDLMWSRRYQELMAFRSEHGHANVTVGNNPSLYEWTKRQRNEYWDLQNGRPTGMTPERIRLLEDVGIIWLLNPKAGKGTVDWAGMHHQLVEWKRTHASRENLADNTDPAYKNLEAWAKKQANLFRMWKSGEQKPSNILGREKFRLLEEVDILSIHRSTRADRWEDKLQQLVEYKREHGDVYVPDKFEPNPELGLWVERERKKGASGTMKESQKRRLEELGFSWLPPHKRLRLASFNFVSGTSSSRRQRAKWDNPNMHTVEGTVVTEEGKSVTAKAIVVNAEPSQAPLFLSFDGQTMPAVADSDILPDQLVSVFTQEPREKKYERETILAVEKGGEDMFSFPVLRNGVKAHLLLGGAFRNRVCDQAMLDSLLEGRVNISCRHNGQGSRYAVGASFLCHNLYPGRELSPTRKEFVALLKKPNGQFHLSRGSAEDAKTILRLASAARERTRTKFTGAKVGLSFLEHSICKQVTEYEVALQLCLGGQERTLSDVGRFFPCKAQTQTLADQRKGGKEVLAFTQTPCHCDITYEIEKKKVPSSVKARVRTCRDPSHHVSAKKTAASSLIAMRDKEVAPDPALAASPSPHPFAATTSQTHTKTG